MNRIKEIDQKIFNSFKKLLNYLNKNGYSGFDPYDIKAQKWVIKITDFGSKNFFLILIREIIFELFISFPLFFRKIFRIKPSINPKAMGLLASSYLDLYECFNEKVYYDNSIYCLRWLSANKANCDLGIGWGYPFHWQSKKFIPKGTPNGIVTTAVGEAFWKHYKISNDSSSLHNCKEICEFLSNLPIDSISNDKLCFSYTPVFINHVHNLNLFVAEFLIKIGLETANNTWIEMGNKAVNYTLSSQSDNGAFDYNGPPELPDNHFDNYHTGFVLRMLYSIWQMTKRQDVYNSIDKCYSHYIANFFENNEIPKLTPQKKYRVDIHSCGESVHCLCTLSELFPEGLKLAENVLNWTIDNFQDQSGYFQYALIKSRFTGFIFKSKIPYIRWGQAWMLRAYTSYFISKKKQIK